VHCSWTSLDAVCAFSASATRNASLAAGGAGGPGAAACALRLHAGFTYVLTTCGAPSTGAPLLRLLAGAAGGAEAANSADEPASATDAPCANPPGTGLAFTVPAAASNASQPSVWTLLAGCAGDGACSGNVSAWAYDPGAVLPLAAPATVARLCVPRARDRGAALFRSQRRSDATHPQSPVPLACQRLVIAGAQRFAPRQPGRA